MPGAFSYGMLPTNSPKGSAFQAIQPSVIPPGFMQIFAGPTAPNGWLICDGSIVSRKTYSNLFSVIGTTFGAGNSNDTFSLPDARGRVIMGAGVGVGLNASGTGAISGSALTSRTLGQWLGEETHLLTTAELASHSHANTVSGGSTGSMSANASHTHSGFAHPLLKYVGTGGNRADLAGGGAWIGTDSSPTTVNTQNTDHTHTFTPSISNVAAGSDSRHATIPPVLVTNLLIKF
jgi:microcystin-dependent protein